MPVEVTGRLVSVRTRFHREAIKPGGVIRSAAVQAVAQSMDAMEVQVARQIAGALGDLVALLRDWHPEHAGTGADFAAEVRDVAGLADRHLLTEIAMYCHDCLDAIAVEGARMDAAEAACYAEALVFANLDRCRGEDLTPYAPLLRELETLTGRVVARA